MLRLFDKRTVCDDVLAVENDNVQFYRFINFLSVHDQSPPLIYAGI